MTNYTALRLKVPTWEIAVSELRRLAESGRLVVSRDVLNTNADTVDFVYIEVAGEKPFIIGLDK